jgi:HD-GYP domain-containing protein (c-di-GMP phosphodiesterase class II)
VVSRVARHGRRLIRLLASVIARAEAALDDRRTSMDGATDMHTCEDVVREADLARSEVEQLEAEFHELSRIGIGLMREHDRKALLRMIVAQAKQLTHSDGGGLLLVRKDDDGHAWLHAVLYAFDSIDGEFLDPAVRLPIDEDSIIGHAALTKQAIVVADAYDLPRNARYHQGTAFDEEFGYCRRSMLAAPMLDQMGHVLGVMICVNRKTDPEARITSKEAADRYVIAYSNREVRLVRMLASQAAVAIENARLYAQIEDAFESFVQAAVSAIDLRDPATAGHSMRVAEMVANLAEDLEHRESGPYRDISFSSARMRELRFAALLHDIGKIAIPEALLLKAKKLPAGGLERIDARFDLIRRTIELESCRGDAQAALAPRLKELERQREVVRTANEPSVLEASVAAELSDIARLTYERPDGTTAPYLTVDELHYLQIPKGTLDEQERARIEAHAMATRDLLSHIPWPEDLKNIVAYAYGHHELLDGSGYPEHLAGAEIPLETRLITLVDIFDALTASDRPYKRAVPVEEALELLRANAAAGELDPELLKVMVESDSYRRRPEGGMKH